MDGRVEAEINRRIQARWNNWRKMSGVLCDKNIPPKVKGMIHQTVVQPAMLYGLETVPQTKKTTQKLEVAEMKMCRWACGVTRRDRIRNDEIRERMGVVNIGVKCRKATLRWYGHVKRREENYIGRKMLSLDPPSRRRRGRPKQRWMDTIRNDMKAVGAREEDAENRNTWKMLISAAATPY